MQRAERRRSGAEEVDAGELEWQKVELEPPAADRERLSFR
jgi:hypothetical protein